MKIQFSLLPLIVMSLGAQSQEKNTLTTKSLYDTERNFSDYCVKYKAKAAFIKYIDDSSIVLFPHPTNGKAFYFMIPDDSKDSSQLSWQPEFVEVSNDGSMGYSYGPARSKRNYLDSTFISSHYMSVWKKRGGDWKLVLDRGVRYPIPYEYKGVSFKENTAGKVPMPKTNNIKSVKDLDKKINANVTEACNEYTIFFRMGRYPFKATDSIPHDLKEIQVWEVQGGDISSSKDLAYVYGYYGLNNQKKEKGYFIRIWKYEYGKWYLRFDLRYPVFMI